MSTIADDDRRVIAGVDTHKDFHVVVVLDELGRRLDHGDVLDHDTRLSRPDRLGDQLR